MCSSCTAWPPTWCRWGWVGSRSLPKRRRVGSRPLPKRLRKAPLSCPRHLVTLRPPSPPPAAPPPPPASCRSRTSCSRSCSPPGRRSSPITGRKASASAAPRRAATSRTACGTHEDRAVVVYLRRGAQDPVLLAKNVVLVLVTESVADLDPQLLRAHATREIEIQRPDPAERLVFLTAVRPPSWYASRSELPAERLAELTAGMNRVQLGQLLDGVDANGEVLSRERVRDIKKAVIETEGLGLLEYVEPKYDLSMVAGMPAVKERLRRAARAVPRGNLAAVPMGYLVCGPVGSAKTFLVECFVKEIGIPCVKLKNFRSMWVGSTESNLERILQILSSLTPGGGVVDEADAAVGHPG